jgi:hypothetical protein
VPQLFESVVVSTQAPLQSVSLLAQTHALNLQASLQVWVPSPLLHDFVDAALHSPSPAQAENVLHVPVLVSQVRSCVPQSPQVWVAAPVHGMLTPVHAPHAHVAALHIWVPLLFAPHICVCVPEQTPSPAHAENALHVPVLVSQVRVCVPHLPHVCEDAPVHVWPVHAPHAHIAATHVCVPPLPHACVCVPLH